MKRELVRVSAVLRIECNFRLTIDNTAGPSKLINLSPDSVKGCAWWHKTRVRGTLGGLQSSFIAKRQTARLSGSALSRTRERHTN